MNKVCAGCGMAFQSDVLKTPGYVIKSKLESALYCERCFRLKHYHEMNFDTLEMQNQELLQKINNYQANVLYFVDLFNLNQESIEWFWKIKGKKILVLSKMDYIPYNISLEKIIYMIRKIYQIEEDIIPMCRRDAESIARLKNKMMGGTVLLAGMTNVGKSTFLNTFLKEYFKKESPVLISEMPNTTQNFMKWSEEGVTIIDAPGFRYKKETTFSKDFTIRVNPEKFIKPLTYPMKKNEGILLEDFFYMTQDLEMNGVTFWGSNDLNIRKVYKTPEEMGESVDVVIPAQSDIVLPGIGFFYFKKGCHVLIKTELSYQIRPSFLGGIHDRN